MSITPSMPPVIEPDDNEIEIRLSDIVQFLKDSRWRVVIWAVAFSILGVFYSLSKPDEFTASVRVMPELKGSSGGGGMGDIRSLAGLAGVNIDNAGAPEAIRPDLYPDIIQSIPFTLYLLGQPVTEGATPFSLERFLTEKSKGGIMGWIAGSQDGKESALPIEKNVKTLQLTSLQESLSRQINQRVTAAIDRKSGIITITSVMPDPSVAAITAGKTLDYLTNYVTNYRTGKARQQLDFLNQQVSNANRRYQSAEYTLSSYRDRNRALFLNTAKIEEQRLQADYLLAQTVFNDLSKQLEQARIKVQEEAPVFQVLEPARVPLQKSAPRRSTIVLGFFAFGALMGLAWSFVRRLIRH